jgi:hypothetical protein
VTYCGSDKKRFQLEVPDNFANKAGKDYELQGQRKGFKKYWTSKTKAGPTFLFVSVAEVVFHIFIIFYCTGCGRKWSYCNFWYSPGIC